MSLKFFAVLAGVAGTLIWVGAAWAASEGVRVSGNPILVGFYLWITAAVLSAFDDVVDYLKTIAENSKKLVLIAQQSAAWAEDNLEEEE